MQITARQVAVQQAPPVATAAPAAQQTKIIKTAALPKTPIAAANQALIAAMAVRAAQTKPMANKQILNLPNRPGSRQP